MTCEGNWREFIFLSIKRQRWTRKFDSWVLFSPKTLKSYGLGWVLENKTTQQIKRSRICEFTLHLGTFVSAILFWPPSCAKAAQNGGCVLLTWFLITRPPRLFIQQDGRERKVELHPKSVNAAVVSFNSNWLIYREKIKSSKVNLWYRVACCY